MPLRIEEKKQAVADIKEIAANSVSLVIADARGTQVSDLTALRKQARESQVVIKVIKNSIAKRAFSDTIYDCTKDVLEGPSLFGFSMEDPGTAARIFRDFSKDVKSFEIKALSIGGELIDGKDINKLANLPTIDQALSMLANVMLAPVSKITRTFYEIPSKTARVFDQVAKQKTS